MPRIPFTCPDINSIQDDIANAIECLQVQSEDPSSLNDAISEAIHCLTGIDDQLEKLRTANESLRAEAENAKEEMEQLQKDHGTELDDLRNDAEIKQEALQNEIQSLKWMIEDLEEKQ